MSGAQHSKPYGLATLTLLVIASMIGSGVFTTSGYTLAAVGSPARVMVCWLIGGGIALCGAVAFGRLARLMPESGGEYLYLTRNVHPMAGFLAGWVSLTAGFSGAIATAAVAFESYALRPSDRPEWLPDDVVAIALVLACGVAHAMHVRGGAILQNIVVVVKLLALAVFLGVVAVRLPVHEWHFAAIESAPTNMWDVTTAIATSVVWISLSYAGFNAAIYVASESEQASRSVPRALLLGTLLVAALYLLLNLAFVTSTDAGQLVGRNDVAAISALSIGGHCLEILIRVTISLGLFSSVSGMLMTGPRVYSQMATDGVFPQLFRIDRHGAVRSVSLQTLLAVALILIQRVLVAAGIVETSLLGLLDYLGTTLSLSSACCVATLFLRRVRQRTDFASSHIESLAAAVYVAATFTSIVLLMLRRGADGAPLGVRHLAGTALTIVTGLVAWNVFRVRGRRHETPVGS
ncbi:MAG: APC family permease [Planctomycetaceae bacterium]